MNPETYIGIFLGAAVSAMLAAVELGYIAHYNFGLSRQEIRGQALAAALLVATLVGVLVGLEFLAKKLGKSK